jgi:hypothetical protein
LLRLQARLGAVIAKSDAAIASGDATLSQNDRRGVLGIRLQRMQFGRRPEKLDPDELAVGLKSGASHRAQRGTAAHAHAEKPRANRCGPPLFSAAGSCHEPCCGSPAYGHAKEAIRVAILILKGKKSGLLTISVLQGAVGDAADIDMIENLGLWPAR